MFCHLYSMSYHIESVCWWRNSKHARFGILLYWILSKKSQSRSMKYPDVQMQDCHTESYSQDFKTACPKVYFYSTKILILQGSQKLFTILMNCFTCYLYSFQFIQDHRSLIDIILNTSMPKGDLAITTGQIFSLIQKLRRYNLTFECKTIHCVLVQATCQHSRLL